MSRPSGGGPAGEGPAPRSRVLVVDDSATDRKLAARLVQRAGGEVEAVDNATEALTYVRRVRPALVLLDLNMPGMGGFDFLRALRAEDALKTTRVVIMTGDRDERRVVESIELGAVDFIVKPVTPRIVPRLSKLINDNFDPLASELAATGAGAAGADKEPDADGDRHVLCVDDSHVVRKMVSRQLANLGYIPASAESGEEALRMLWTRSKAGGDPPQFGAILLDINMSGMRGQDVLVKLQSDPDFREIPVFMLSSQKDNETVAECLQLGAMDFLGKPVQKEALQRKLDNAFERGRRMRWVSWRFSSGGIEGAEGNSLALSAAASSAPASGAVRSAAMRLDISDGVFLGKRSVSEPKGGRLRAGPATGSAGASQRRANAPAPIGHRPAPGSAPERATGVGALPELPRVPGDVGPVVGAPSARQLPSLPRLPQSDPEQAPGPRAPGRAHPAGSDGGPAPPAAPGTGAEAEAFVVVGISPQALERPISSSREPSDSGSLSSPRPQEPRQHPQPRGEGAAAAAAAVAVAGDDRPSTTPVVVAVSPAWLEQTGCKREDVVGKPYSQFFGAKTDPQASASLQAAVLHSTSAAATILHYRSDGTPFWAQVSAWPLMAALSDSADTTFSAAGRRKLERALGMQLPSPAVSLVALRTGRGIDAGAGHDADADAAPGLPALVVRGEGALSLLREAAASAALQAAAAQRRDFRARRLLLASNRARSRGGFYFSGAATDTDVQSQGSDASSLASAPTDGGAPPRGGTPAAYGRARDAGARNTAKALDLAGFGGAHRPRGHGPRRQGVAGGGRGSGGGSGEPAGIDASTATSSTSSEGSRNLRLSAAHAPAQRPRSLSDAGQDAPPGAAATTGGGGDPAGAAAAERDSASVSAASSAWAGRASRLSPGLDAGHRAAHAGPGPPASAPRAAPPGGAGAVSRLVFGAEGGGGEASMAAGLASPHVFDASDSPVPAEQHQRGASGGGSDRRHRGRAVHRAADLPRAPFDVDIGSLSHGPPSSEAREHARAASEAPAVGVKSADATAVQRATGAASMPALPLGFRGHGLPRGAGSGGAANGSPAALPIAPAEVNPPRSAGGVGARPPMPVLPRLPPSSAPAPGGSGDDGDDDDDDDDDAGSEADNDSARSTRSDRNLQLEEDEEDDEERRAIAGGRDGLPDPVGDPEAAAGRPFLDLAMWSTLSSLPADALLSFPNIQSLVAAERSHAAADRRDELRGLRELVESKDKEAGSLSRSVEKHAAQVKTLQKANSQCKRQVAALTDQTRELRRRAAKDRAYARSLLREATRRGYLPSVLLSKPDPAPPVAEDKEVLHVRSILATAGDGVISPLDKVMQRLTVEVCGFPSYFSIVIAAHIEPNNAGISSPDKFLAFWDQNIRGRDRVERFWNVIRKPAKDYIEPDDLMSVISGMMFHPQLYQFRTDRERRRDYADMVKSCIFFTVNRRRNLRISLPEMRGSNLVEAFLAVDKHNLDRIQPFSIKYFDELHHTFTQLDSENDGSLSTADLIRYPDVAVSPRLASRVLLATPQRIGAPVPSGRLSFADFVWFTLSVKDRMSDSSLDFWFHCFDVDDDGYLSGSDMATVYTAKVDHLQREAARVGQIIDFELTVHDAVCQITDLVGPSSPDRMSVLDIRRAGAGEILFELLVAKKEGRAARSYLS